MPSFALTLRVDAANPPDSAAAVLGSESQRVRQALYRSLRLTVRSHAWITLDLGTAKAKRTIEALLEERRAGRAIVGSAQLVEKLDERDDISDWFLLGTKQVSGSFSLWDDYPQCRAGTLPAVHALNHTFVSTQFVTAYERAKLTGLSFLRCRNSGRKPGAAWFVALPAHSLGNGLDHPWFDRARWLSYVKDDRRKRATSLAVGQNVFHQFWLRLEAREDPFVAELLELCPMPAQLETTLAGLTFVMAPRYLRRAEPSEDFAYVPWGEDGPNREGKMQRHRQLMIRRRARQILLDSGLFHEREFYRVKSVAAPEPGVELLDGRYEPVSPMYTGEEQRALRERERGASQRLGSVKT